MGCTGPDENTLEEVGSWGEGRVKERVTEHS